MFWGDVYSLFLFCKESLTFCSPSRSSSPATPTLLKSKAEQVAWTWSCPHFLPPPPIWPLGGDPCRRNPTSNLTPMVLPSSRLPITACFFKKSLQSFLFSPKANMLWVKVLQQGEEMGWGRKGYGLLLGHVLCPQKVPVAIPGSISSYKVQVTEGDGKDSLSEAPAELRLPIRDLMDK